MSVQTSINATLAFGFPGAHGNGQPWVADTAIAATAMTFGRPAGTDATGNVGIYDGTTYATFAGVVVGPHEHVIQKLPDDVSTITVPIGETVAIAKKGSWFVTIENDQAVKAGSAIYAKAGVFTTTVTGNQVAEVLAVEDDIPASGYMTVLVRFL